MIEIGRSSHSVTYQQADGSCRAVISTAPMHWHDGEAWQTVDLAWRARDDGRCEVPSAAYLATFDPSQCLLEYRSRRQGWWRLRLVSVDGAPPASVIPEFECDGAKLRLRLGGGMHLVVVARAHSVEVFRRYDGPALPVLEWEVQSSGVFTTNLLKIAGVDNVGRRDLMRRDEVLWRNERRFVEVVSTVLDESILDGITRRRVREEVTGRTRRRDPKTRVASWQDGIVFPVLLDVTVTEDIVANADDGHAYDAGASETWFDSSGNIYFDNHNSPAWRFQTVAVTQGATITSATLRVNVSNTGDYSSAMHGQASDSAPAWTAGSSNGPNRMSRTTANITFTGFGSLGFVTLTVTTVIQEIVNRAGWASGNDMRLGCLDTASGTNNVIFTPYNYNPSNAGRLVIDYTAAATSAGVSPVLGDHRPYPFSPGSSNISGF